MSVITRGIARAFAPLTRGMSASQIPMGTAWQLGRPWNLTPEYTDFPWAYRLVPTVQFCVDLYQSTIAATPLKFYVGEGDRKRELERAPGNIADMWAKANTEQTGYELTEDLVGSLEIFGNAYLFKDFAGTRKVQQFWMLNPGTCKPVHGSGRAVTSYEVQEGGRVVKVPRDQIVHFKRYDPEMGALGVSRLQALSLAYETQRDSARYQRLFYQKGAQAAGHYSTENAINDDDVERLKAQFRKHSQGLENSWDPVLLPKALKYVRAGLTMAEMQFIESYKMTSAEMYKIFKIPPMLAGHLEGGTGLNSDVASVSMELFLRFGIMPATTRIAQKLNESLLGSGEFGFNVSCEYDFSNDPVMVEAWLKQAEMWNKATGAPHVSRAEARDHQGLPPRGDEEGLDDILVPMGMQSAALAREQAEVDLENAKNPPEPPPSALPPGTPPANPEPEPQRARTLDRAMNRDVQRARASRRLASHEAKVATFARRHFLAQTKRVKKAIRAQSRAYELNEILAQLDDPAAIKKARRLIRGIVSDAGDDAIAELAQDLSFALQASQARAFIDDKGAKLVRDIDATTRANLQAALSDAFADGAGLDKTISQLDKALMEVDGVMGDRLERASRIARTETSAAYNFGTLEGYRQSGVVAYKEWLTSGDEHVRDSHKELGAMPPIPLDAEWVAPEPSGARLMFPGDPNCGDAGEVVNCRCTMIPVVSPMERDIPEPIVKRLQPGVNGSTPGKRISLEAWLRNGTPSR